MFDLGPEISIAWFCEDPELEQNIIGRWHEVREIGSPHQWEKVEIKELQRRWYSFKGTLQMRPSPPYL